MELDAYQRLTEQRLSVWEVRTLKKMDGYFLTAINKSQEVNSKTIAKRK
jgi:hypothetical protein